MRQILTADRSTKKKKLQHKPIVSNFTFYNSQIAFINNASYILNKEEKR